MWVTEFEPLFKVINTDWAFQCSFPLSTLSTHFIEVCTQAPFFESPLYYLLEIIAPCRSGKREMTFTVTNAWNLSLILTYPKNNLGWSTSPKHIIFSFKQCSRNPVFLLWYFQYKHISYFIFTFQSVPSPPPKKTFIATQFSFNKNCHCAYPNLTL